MRNFDYVAPSSIEEAVAILEDKGRHARPIAGGTDLIPRMRNGLLEPSLLVDVKKIPELNEMNLTVGGLVIGAAVPLYLIYGHAGAAAAYPCLMDAARNIGGAAIQGRATIGGNLCNAAPSGDSIPSLIVQRATCNIAGPRGRRGVPVERFCTAPGRTVLRRGEILVSVRLPVPQRHSGAMYTRFIPRGEMDIAVAGAGASLTLDTDGAIKEARVALGAVAPTPLLVKAAGDALVGQTPSEEAFGEAAALAQAAAKPISDVRGSAELRVHLVGVLTGRALRGALARVNGGETR